MRLGPTEGSQQAGIRPAVIVSRNAINRYSPVLVILSFARAANVKRDYPNNVRTRQGDGGLTADSAALTGQVRAIAKTRLLPLRGSLSPAIMKQLDRALRVTLDL